MQENGTQQRQNGAQLQQVALGAALEAQPRPFSPHRAVRPTDMAVGLLGGRRMPCASNMALALHNHLRICILGLHGLAAQDAAGEENHPSPFPEEPAEHICVLRSWHPGLRSDLGLGCLCLKTDGTGFNLK